MDRLQQALRGGFWRKLRIYGGMSGPGWIQAAVTLGGGSLVGALYLGVIGGYEFLWLQPLAMLCGVVMLAAISHVTLSSEERPFRLMKKRISPVLAWSWLGATVVADVVFCAAQFALGRGALEDNLGIVPPAFVTTGVLFVVSLGLIALSQKNERAAWWVNQFLKLLVSVIVLAFLGVAVVLLVRGVVPIGQVLAGLVPDFSALFRPTDSIAAAIARTGSGANFWTDYVTGQQRDKIIAAFGTAVGINMTFLLPYTLKKRGWGRRHRELSRFDLVLGLLIPFMLGVSALVITSAASFHGKSDDVLDAQGQPRADMEKIYYEVVDKRIAFAEPGFADLSEESKVASGLRDELPRAERELAAMLSNRKAKNLAESLRPFLGNAAPLVFGIGVLAMALSTMMVHMMMNGYAISEALNRLGSAKVFIFGAAMPAVAGLFSPILWSGDAKAAMQIPASIIATVLLPIAYLGFLLLMNSRAALGEDLPKRRFGVNLVLGLAAGAASFASVWALANKGMPGTVGIVLLVALAATGIGGYFKRTRNGDSQ